MTTASLVAAAGVAEAGQQDPFHGPDILVQGAEIGSQGNDGISHLLSVARRFFLTREPLAK